MSESSAESIDLVIEGESVITMDAERRVISDGAVAIHDGRIRAVGARSELERAYPRCRRRVPGAGKAVIPGLIDAHGHAGHALLKAVASDSVMGWMPVVTDVYFNHTTPEFWYLDGLLSAAERLRCGVTTGLSVIASRPRSTRVEPVLEHARAYAEAGPADLIAVGPVGLPTPYESTEYVNGAWVPSRSSLADQMAVTESVVDAVHGSRGGLTQVYVTPLTIVQSVFASGPATPEQARSITKDDREHSAAVRDLARRRGLRIHSDAFGGMVRMAVQDPDNMLLGPDVHVQHVIGLFPDEVRILAETGTGVSHAPVGNAPLVALLGAGVTLAITSDGCAPRQGFDMLEAARAILLGYGFLHDDRYLLPPGKLLEMITVDAAAVLGLGDEIGSLEPGKRADVTVVDVRQPHLSPYRMPVHQLMYRASGNDVTTVVVAGRVVVDDGEVVTVDVPAAIDAANECARATIARAGIEEHLTSPGWGELYRSFA